MEAIKGAMYILRTIASYQEKSVTACFTNQRQGANRLTAELGRRPLAQTCPRCHQIVFEGEPGFVQRYLLVDIV